MNAPFPKHEAHNDGGFAPWHTVAIIPMQAVLLFRVPDMHAAHKGLAEVARRLGVGHELALGAHVWYPGSEGEPQQTLIDKSQLKKAPQLLLLLLLLLWVTNRDRRWREREGLRIEVVIVAEIVGLRGLRRI